MDALALAVRPQGDRAGCVQSLVRAFGLLDQLASHHEGLSLTRIAGLVGLPRSTAHRLLTTMESLRYAAFDPATNRWMVGARALAFVGGRADGDDLGRLARPVMQSVLRGVRATVTLSVPDGECARVVGQVRHADAQRSFARPGQRLPLHTTASGKVILAHDPTDGRESALRAHSLPALTASSITEAGRLACNLATVRERGYAIDDQESATGVRCVAVPVVDRSGAVRAALSVSGSVLTLTDARLPSLGATLAFAAQRMTADLGGLIPA